jgi:microcin C transport system permease protein
MHLTFWQKFRKNRRAYRSLIIFLCIFGISLLSTFVANNKPIIVIVGGDVFVPVLKKYPETAFKGGEFETEAVYQDPYWLSIMKNQNAFILWPLLKFSYNTNNFSLPTPAPSPPSAENWLGTDDQGRDVLARILYGLRLSILFGLALTISSAAIGILAGAVQGYFGGWVDLLFQRFIEIWSGLPLLYVLIILTSFIEPNVWWLLLILLLFSWTSLVGVVRAEFLKGRNMEYVRAAKALGVPEPIIILRHILPNCLIASVTILPFMLSGSVTVLTELDFLGLGLPPGSPSLGELLAQGKTNLHAPWLGISGFIIVGLLLSLLVFIGEGVRDALNPRKNR